MFIRKAPGPMLISSIEAATGLMVFAIATGLLYGRFSRPSARIIYSKNAIIAPYQDGTSLQFRVTNARRNVLMNMEARVLLMTVDSTRRRTETQFHRPAARAAQRLFLRADLDHRASHRCRRVRSSERRARTWPKLSAEILILIQGFDDTFSQVVHSRYSYRHDEIVWGAKFIPSFQSGSQGRPGGGSGSHRRNEAGGLNRDGDRVRQGSRGMAALAGEELRAFAKRFGWCFTKRPRASRPSPTIMPWKRRCVSAGSTA